MAAGTAAASGHTGRGSSAAIQSSLDRRFQGVSNTMESIQGLSNWCIENKKYHSLIVRYWMKWLKKSGASQMLNLFYVANDVIQNCKRKNAIVYRTAFSEVLPEATRLVKDAKVCKSVERILTIWDERSVYPEELISELRAGLAPPSAQSSAPSNPKAALKSKILAEFAPQAFIDKLSEHSRSLEESELKEKQLAALRVDVCSSEALKRLKDKAGGKKFSKDFEEGSTKLQDFVGFLEKQLKGGPPLLEALSNADVFYEMQYKEVKIIANAYKTFANRVTHLKRKLDALKSTLPGLDDSPVPSPSEDAPSPTGSESPFHGMGAASAAGLDGQAMGDGDEAGITLGDAPSPLSSPGASPVPDVPHGEKDNRDVEDMELSEGEDTGSPGIIVEEQAGKPAPIPELKPAEVPAKPLLAREENPVRQVTPPVTSAASASPMTSLTPVTSTTTATSITLPVSAAPVAPVTTLPVNLANVDLGKISSILSSLTSVMKNTGVSPVSRTSPSTPSTPSAQGSALKSPATAPGGAAPGPNPLASILSRVDISPETLLSALSKTQSTGLQGMSLLQSVAGGSSGTSSTQQPASTAPPRGLAPGPIEAAPAPSPMSPVALEERASAPPLALTPKPLPGCGYTREPDRKLGRERESTPPVSSFPSSLESKMHKFLQANPGFRAFNLNLPSGDGQGSSSNSPFLPAENLDGTPVRDEAPGTPTQDEMDEPSSDAFLTAPTSSSHNGGVRAGLNVDPTSLVHVKSLPSSAGLGAAEFRDEPWGAPDLPQSRYGEGVSNRQGYHPLRCPDPMSGLRDTSQDEYGVGSGNPPRGVEDFSDGRSEGAGGDGRGVTAGEHYPLHPLSTGERLRSSGEPNAPGGGGGGEGECKPGALTQEGPHYQHIETLVSPSSCGEGAPIESLGYNHRRPSGERIQTVESIRVIGRGTRPHPRGGESGPRPGLGRGGGWYGEAYAEGAGARPRNPGPQGLSDDDSLQAFPFEERGRAPYPGRAPHPSRHSRVPPSDFFSSPPPPIPAPPPPPIPQLPPPPNDFPGLPSSVMVGGVLVPVDRPLSQPPSRGGDREERSGPLSATTPPALFRDLPPHHGAVKDHFPPRQGPPLHRPDPSRPPPSMRGRVRDGPSPPPSSLALPSPPLGPSRLQPNQHLPHSPPPRPHPNHRPQLRPPHHQLRPALPHPAPRPPLRGHNPRPPRPAHFNQEPPYRGVKRPGPRFSGPPRGGFAGSPFPPKRPYLPPRY